MSYDMNITISTSHGVGYEFTTPSENPKINISQTNMPIEEYYFSKYTDNKDFSKVNILRIHDKEISLVNFILIGGKKLIAVEKEGNILLRNIGFKYSENDSIKEIEFLRLFGDNQKDYWNDMNPNEEAKFLFKENEKEIQARGFFDM